MIYFECSLFSSVELEIISALHETSVSQFEVRRKNDGIMDRKNG